MVPRNVVQYAQDMVDKTSNRPHELPWLYQPSWNLHSASNQSTTQAIAFQKYQLRLFNATIVINFDVSLREAQWPSG